MRIEGTLKTWNDDRGFGFIEPLQGGQGIFVHIKAFAPGSGRPQPNQLVSFEVEIGPQGRKRAKNVAPLRASRTRTGMRRDSPVRWGTATLFAIPAFAVLKPVEVPKGMNLQTTLDAEDAETTMRPQRTAEGKALTRRVRTGLIPPRAPRLCALCVESGQLCCFQG